MKSRTVLLWAVVLVVLFLIFQNKKSFASAPEPFPVRRAPEGNPDFYFKKDGEGCETSKGYRQDPQRPLACIK